MAYEHLACMVTICIVRVFAWVVYTTLNYYTCMGMHDIVHAGLGFTHSTPWYPCLSWYTPWAGLVYVANIHDITNHLLYFLRLKNSRWKILFFWFLVEDNFINGIIISFRWNLYHFKLHGYTNLKINNNYNALYRLQSTYL